MKSIVLSSVVTALLLFTGCADKEPVIDDSSTNQQVVQEVEDVKTETVSSENSMMNSSGMNMSMSEIENQLPAIYFAFDKFSISSEMQSDISTGVSIANDAGSDFNVKLEGNCDEWGSDEYNFALGLKRANAVKKALIAEGVSESRVSMVSYGESNPTCSDKTQECWSKNRRVNFKLLP
ncbi:MAG: peptidoglycan-associated lipoprotein [Epsilonproteobacteria bacterium]|nr:MAG: peptidoglycan-associated lipoprotein [Campylobacterota bacterium]